MNVPGRDPSLWTLSVLLKKRTLSIVVPYLGFIVCSMVLLTALGANQSGYNDGDIRLFGAAIPFYNARD